jgi:dienelactone hydrolase
VTPSIRTGAGRAAAAAMLAAALLCACATPQERAADLDATWRSALVVMPRDPASAKFIHFGSATSWAEAVAVAGATPRTKVPAVIHLHGCGGRDLSDQSLSAFYASQGYAFFGPYSFARAGRRVMCGPGQMDYRMAMRLEEAQFALAQLRNIDWIDQQRIVLSGFSEGAQGASSYAGHEFAAIVLLGTDCRFVGNAARAPRNVPVINIVGSADSFGYGNGCATHGAPGSRTLVIRDGMHDVSPYPDAMRALGDFLSMVRH